MYLSFICQVYVIIVMSVYLKYTWNYIRCKHGSRRCNREYYQYKSNF